MEFLNNAKIGDDALVLTPVPVRVSFNAAAVAIPFASFGTAVGFIEQHDTDDDQRLEMTTHNSLGDRCMISGAAFDDIKANAPALVEIPAMKVWIPLEVFYHDGAVDQSASDRFVHDVFTEVAQGRASKSGYGVRALVNPAAVDHVDDKGAYRAIYLKPEYGKGFSEVETPLTVAELQARLKPPAP